MVFLRVKLKQPFISNRWKWSITISFFISMMNFHVQYMRYIDKDMVNEFFSSVDLDKGKHSKMWSYPGVFFNLIAYIILKFTFNMLSLSMPLAAGAFGPAFAMGAGFGRTFAYAVKNIGLKFGLTLIKCILNYIYHFIS
jgi:H+/Cl- antiporter ClcA